MNSWNASEAKRHFGEVVQAAALEPQILLLRGRPVGVVVDYDRFKRTEAQRSERTVREWLDELEPLRHEEDDPETPRRSNRRDQFGDDWE